MKEAIARAAAALLLALPAAPALAQATGKTPAIQVDETFLVGRWTDDGDCSDAVEFDADGTFIASNGGSGDWSLRGNALTISGTATMTMRILPVDHDTILVLGSDGAAGRSTRCDLDDDDDSGPPPLRIA
jgi:hypothetical protein